MSKASPLDPYLSEARSLFAQYAAEVAPIPHFTRIRPADLQSGRAVLAADPRVQLAFVEVALAAAAALRAARPTPGTRTGADDYHPLTLRLQSLLRLLARRPLPYELLDAARTLDLLARNVHSGIPVDSLLLGLATVLAGRELSEEERRALVGLRGAPHQGYGAPTPGDRRVIATATKLLDGSLLDRPALERGDDWGSAARESLDSLPEEEKRLWLDLLRHAETVMTDPPTDKWLAQARERVAALGEARFGALASAWLGFLSLPLSHRTYRDASGRTVARGLVAKPNAKILRGLVWSCTLAADERLARAVAGAAEACSAKVEGWGPRSVVVANTCLRALAAWPEPSGAAQLQRLSGRVPSAAALAFIASPARPPD